MTVQNTSGTTAFNMDFVEVAEEAWERAGREMRSGYDLRTARRSMNLLTIEWANRGINMWTITESSIEIPKGTVSIELDPGSINPDSSSIVPFHPTPKVIDIIEQTIRPTTGQESELTLARVGVSTYANITNKSATGRPNQMYVERGVDGVTGYFWPVPDKSYTLKFWYLRRIEDVRPETPNIATTGNHTPDMPFRFLPCLVSGLAYYIAMKTPELSGRVMMLKDIYDEQFEMAAAEDRTKVSAKFVPRIGYV